VDSNEAQPVLLSEMLITTKDGDWGEEHPREGFIPYYVIRGADFPNVRVGNASTVPKRFLDSSTVVRRTLQPNDLIIETAGGNHDRPTGRTLLVTKKLLRSLTLPATCASFCRFLRVDPTKADPGFVFWYLQNLYGQGEMWQHQVQHTGVARFQYTRFASSADIPLPSLRDQSAVAETLSALDDKIALNCCMNETLEAMARAIFGSWFVDFDPVHAKAKGRHPFGMDASTAALFPSSFEDSELGRIPKGWKVATLGRICEVIDCLHSRKPDRQESGKPLLQLWNIRDDGLIDMSKAYWITPGDYQRWISRMEAAAGDCVITNVGRVGAVGQLPYGLKAALGRNMTGVRCRASFPFPTFLIECLLSNAMREEIVAKADSGTILDALNVRNIPRLRLIEPTLKVSSLFETTCRPLRERMEKNHAESDTLAGIRDTLLPKLISGEIRIKDAEKTVGEAV
jgi:type I restriction enzyme, S subunit